MRFSSTVNNPSYTLATQWLERSLEDAANRRIVLAEAFLSADALCNLLISIVRNLFVNKSAIHKNLENELPFLLLETLIMLGVKEGKDQHQLQQKYQLLAIKMRENPAQLVSSFLQEELSSMRSGDIEKYISISALIGMAPLQVEEFLKNAVEPLLKKEKIPVFIPPIR